MTESDETLYGRFLAERREEDFRELMERHRESLILFLYGYVHSMEDAEDLMIDAFAEAAAGPTFFYGRSSFKTWLFSIGKNLARMRLRKARRAAALPDEPADGTAEPPELGILRDERNRQLYQALRQLNEEYRQILILLYFEQMSRDEAARVMGKSKKQVYHLAERSRKALKEELHRMGFDHVQY